ncbi:MAG: cob(I)yrinic acid a,c-diamide adenosyltransferase [Cyclobacteriaceae bacterium]|jgi:cob(I)alamin adenosyltransferase|nr:cob(I)yrinic acid a,c-diamide adenosyltransferase [Flammeovirgaceae bacterium]MCZ8020345.1 cob(I)yrinic acid a,c-diamide adenosyltransferase [Cytophagales bacterium]MCZ8327190.1 cob(I)yrinic acid a,c-diamide adenosyltransferase [Cyclobacteriaceae bacterium]
MKIYTKTGDKGTTALFGGKRVAKNDLRVEAYGTIDELNSWLGLLRDQPVNTLRKELLIQIQNDLFVIGSILATEPGNDKVKVPSLKAEHIQDLEKAMDEMDLVLPPMRFFVLPGGHPTVSYCHIARTVCRRAERNILSLHQAEPVSEWVLQYVNRLSDYLFMLSRKLTAELNAQEIPWIPVK